jgi:RNA polymerase sigma factor (sigma-70 family)
MAGRKLTGVMRQLRRAVALAASTEVNDAQLLERYLRDRDEAAFELIVRRHGPMVLNVCCRTLRRLHDAEDAFQATFLTLVLKAQTIGKRGSLASWLYKVAYRIALRARGPGRMPSLPLDRRLRDATMHEPLIELLGQEFGRAFDQELHRLPERYRSTFIDCFLEGRTIDAVARSLGCPAATIGTRLARAKQLLRRRLADRGYGSMALGSIRTGLPMVTAALVSSTLNAASAASLDQALAGGVISSNVACMTKGALRTMSINKWSLVMSIVLALGVLGGTATWLCHRVEADETVVERKAEDPKAPKGSDVERDSGVLLAWKFEKGKTFYHTMTTTTEQTMQITGNNVKQSQQLVFITSWTPVRTDKNGNWVLRQTFEGVKGHVTIAGQDSEWDSTKQESKSALGEFYDALVGAVLEVTLDEEYRITRIEGREELAKKLGRLNPPSADLVKSILGENALRDWYERSFRALHRDRVEAGDTWKRRYRQDNGPMGSYDTTLKYTYKGTQGGFQRVDIQSTMKYVPPDKESEKSFEITGSQMKRMEGSGTILYDPKAGRIAKMELDENVEGDLTIAISNQTTKVGFVQVQKTVLETSDTSPVAQPKPKGNSDEAARLREENRRLKQQIDAIEQILRQEREIDNLRAENERLRKQLKLIEEALRREERGKGS